MTPNFVAAHAWFVKTHHLAIHYVRSQAASAIASNKVLPHKFAATYSLFSQAVLPTFISTARPSLTINKPSSKASTPASLIEPDPVPLTPLDPRPDPGLMEPLTLVDAAIALAGKASDLGAYIHKVYQGSKTVSSDIRGLLTEVKDLAITCDLIHEQLPSILAVSDSDSTASYDPDGKLAARLHYRIVHCDKAVDELRGVVEALWPRKKAFLDRTIARISLQNAKEQIGEKRDRIRSHTDALHTVLLVVNIRMSHIAPAIATNRLSALLDELRSRLSNIEAKLDPTKTIWGATDPEDTMLLECAHDNLRSGTTCY